MALVKQGNDDVQKYTPTHRDGREFNKLRPIADEFYPEADDTSIAFGGASRLTSVRRSGLISILLCIGTVLDSATSQPIIEKHGHCNSPNEFVIDKRFNCVCA
ncbi:uncharacterized protein LOC111056689 [Nilaparvata lugens]|uniref:uncharacterized protein LOC111056689 n=1 Tax=Nilaparvata lugens TaxID=108931 RepID=UPI000B990643|nr:uncharacterized protein LOC111056689 [Nilaparvata lugens]